MTRYYDWKNNIKKDELNEVVNILKNDGIVIFPTETVYAIGGNALSKNVVNRIYEVKRRPREKAINIILGSKNDIEKYAEIKCELESKIIDKCMPGPITMILNKKNKEFGDCFTRDDNTIGIRIPDNKIVSEMLKQIDFPIIAPSANISGCASGIDAKEIAKDFDGLVDAIIDGGVAKIGQSSTIVKVVNNNIEVLRKGTITKQELEIMINR